MKMFELLATAFYLTVPFQLIVASMSWVSEVLVPSSIQNFIFILCSVSLLSLSYNKDVKHIHGTQLLIMVNGMIRNLVVNVLHCVVYFQLDLGSLEMGICHRVEASSY
jgi:hypothetical protein